MQHLFYCKIILDQARIFPVADKKTGKRIDEKQRHALEVVNNLFQNKNKDVSAMILSDNDIDAIEDYYDNNNVGEYEKQMIDDFKGRLLAAINKKIGRIDELLNNILKPWEEDERKVKHLDQNDAEKAAPLLGTKILEKKVRGKPSMPVTGFRETAWVAASKKLWQSGADVFLSKDGETFKELKAADYIPVGATLNVDGIKCRIDAVNFAADEVRLTNIEDKNRPIRFSESIQYVRAYVEDAGTAIYDTIPKKPAARESIRDKLKSAQKAQPTHTPKPQKSKGKDMVL